MGAYPEPPSEPSKPRESVTWIGRDRLPAHPAAPAESEVVGSPLPASLRNNTSRWIIGGAILLLVLIAALVARHFLKPAPIDVAKLAQTQLPVVSVVSPGVKAVTATVTFTGTIAARYDMPISAEGEGGRITAVLVEAGDNVKRGQVLARIDQSVLRPQVNRLVASLEEARAQAALSAAEYRRAQGVSAAGALSAEEIERRRAASVTDEARVKVAAAQLAEAEARLGKTANARAGRRPRAHAQRPKSARPRAPAASRCSGSRAMARSKCAARSRSGSRGARRVDQTRARLPHRHRQAVHGKVRLLGAVIDPQPRGSARSASRCRRTRRLRPGAFARGEVVVGRAQRAGAAADRRAVGRRRHLRAHRERREQGRAPRGARRPTPCPRAS